MAIPTARVDGAAAVLSVLDVHKYYELGRDARPCAARRQPRCRAGRIRRDHGRERQRQVHAHEHPRMSRPPEQRTVSAGRHRRLTARQDAPSPRSGIAASASCSRDSICSRAPRRSRTSAPHALHEDRRARARATRAPRGARARGSREPRRPLSVADVGRPAAARGHRAGTGQPTRDPPGRRAHRQPRQPDVGRDHGRCSRS